jgi:uncharacterized membrane protein
MENADMAGSWIHEPKHYHRQRLIDARLDYNGGFDRKESSMLTPPVVAAVLAPLVLWRMYSRIRRLTTRQRSRTWRHRTTLVFFPLLVLALAAVSLQDGADRLAGLGAGLPVGAMLGRRDRQDPVRADRRANSSSPRTRRSAWRWPLLFMGRMAWRAYEFYALGSFAHHEFVTSPLTLVIFGVLAGYYMSYAFGLLPGASAAHFPLPQLNETMSITTLALIVLCQSWSGASTSA